MSLRHPTEGRTLALTLIALVALLVIFSPFTLGGLVLFVGAGLAFNALAIAASVRRIRQQGQPAATHPGLDALVARCGERIGLTDPVDVLVLDSPVANAYAVGLQAPFTVVVHTGLLRILDRDELAFVIGHELGHVALRHTRLLGVIGQLGTQTFGLPVVSFFIRQVVFLAWMRVTEFSADRAGLLACGSLDTAIRTQLKIHLGPARAATTDVAALMAHWREHDTGWSAAFGDAMRTHPGLASRLDRLVDFDRQRSVAPI